MRKDEKNDKKMAEDTTKNEKKEDKKILLRSRRI